MEIPASAAGYLSHMRSHPTHTASLLQCTYLLMFSEASFIVDVRGHQVELVLLSQQPQ